MKEDKINRITKRAETAHLAEERYKSLSLQNVQQDFDERKKQAVAYALAQAEMWEAKELLRAEIESV